MWKLVSRLHKIIPRRCAGPTWNLRCLTLLVKKLPSAIRLENRTANRKRRDSITMVIVFSPHTQGIFSFHATKSNDLRVSSPPLPCRVIPSKVWKLNELLDLYKVFVQIFVTSIFHKTIFNLAKHGPILSFNLSSSWGHYFKGQNKYFFPQSELIDIT